MRHDRSWDGSSLRDKETRIKQGYAVELLFSIVVFSIFLGLSINLTASWLFQAFQRQVLFIIIISSPIVLLTIIVFAPCLLITIRKFHQGIEILLPCLVSKQDVETIRVRYPDKIMELLHAALQHRSAEERTYIAQILQSTYDDNAAVGQEFAMSVLKLVQFLFAVRVVQDLARLLGVPAAFCRSREVMQLQSSIIINQ